MPSPRRWDARLHAFIGRLPTTAGRPLAAPALHASPTTAGSGWSSRVLLASGRGPLRRGAIRGIGSLAVSSALVNVVLKRFFGRVRPDLENLQAHRRLRREPGTPVLPERALRLGGGVRHRRGHGEPAGRRGAGAASRSASATRGCTSACTTRGTSSPGWPSGGAVAAATQHWWRVRPKQPARVRTASEAPALPEGEGLVVAVNPRSGPDDYDPAEDITGCSPGARCWS